MPLKPHEIFGVEPPGLPFKCLRCQILCLGALHVVKDEEQGLRREAQEEVNLVRPRGRQLRVVGGREAGVARQVRPQALRIRGVWHVEKSALEHGVLQLGVLVQRHWAKGGNAH